MVSNLNPKLLYLKLIDEGDLDADFVAACATIGASSATLRMNVALAELPDFSALPGSNVAAASSVRHHHGAVAQLYGTRLFRCAHARLVDVLR